MILFISSSKPLKVIQGVRSQDSFLGEQRHCLEKALGEFWCVDHVLSLGLKGADYINSFNSNSTIFALTSPFPQVPL